MINVFVICTVNSCRSVLGEALFNHLGAGRIQAFSAGSHPKGKIKPDVLATLQRHGLPTQALKNQSWNELARQSVPNDRFWDSCRKNRFATRRINSAPVRPASTTTMPKTQHSHGSHKWLYGSSVKILASLARC